MNDLKPIFPVWQCNVCGKYNRYHDTFLEICPRCQFDHTSDWWKHIVDYATSDENIEQFEKQMHFTLDKFENLQYYFVN